MRYKRFIAAAIVLAIVAGLAVFILPRHEQEFRVGSLYFDMEEILRNDTLNVVVGAREPLIYEDMGVAITVLRFDSVSWMGNTWNHRAILVEPMVAKEEYAAIFLAGSGPASFNETFLEMYGLRAAVESGVPVLLLYDVPPDSVLSGKSVEELLVSSISEFRSSGKPSDVLIYAVASSIMRAATLVNTVAHTHPTKFVVSGSGISAWGAVLAANADPRIVAVAVRSIPAWDLKSAMELTEGGPFIESVREALSTLSEDQRKTFLECYDPKTVASSLEGDLMVVFGASESPGPLGLTYDSKDHAPLIAVILDERGAELESVPQASFAWRIFLKHVVTGSPLPRIGDLTMESADGSIRASLKLNARGTIVRNVDLWYSTVDEEGRLTGKWLKVRMQDEGGGRFYCEIPSQGKPVIAFAEIWFTSEGSDGMLTTPPTGFTP